MNREVFLSLLALDSYNRGYGQNVLLDDGNDTSGVNELGNRIGNATVVGQSDVDSDTDGVNAGFYAIAYEWQGETIISYRGTDNLNFLEAQSDIWTGWSLGAGFPDGSQAMLAAANDNVHQMVAA